MELLFFIALGCGVVWFMAKVVWPILGGIFKAGGNIAIGIFQLAFCCLVVGLVIAAMN